MAPRKSAEELRDLYWDEKISNINGKLDDIKDLISAKASAGSVQRLQIEVDELKRSHIPCGTVITVQKEVQELMKTHHKFVREEFEPVKRATEGAVFFSKHPALFKMVIIGAFVIMIVSAVGILPTWFMYKNYTLNLKRSQTEQVNTQK